MSEEKKEPDKKSTAAGLAQKAGEALIPVLITAGSLLGFVAFAGAVILWTRLSAVGVPPEQAIDVAPQGELVAIGSVFLLLFGFFGALALAAVFLVDRLARPTPGMARMLLFLLMIEGAVAIVMVGGRSPIQTVADAELFVLPLALLAWATMVGRFGELKDDLRAREDVETEPPRTRQGVLRSCKPHKRAQRVVLFGPVLVVLLAALAAVAVLVLGSSDRLFFWLLSGLGVVFLVWVFLLQLYDQRVCQRTRDRERKAEANAARAREREANRPHHRFLRRICGVEAPGACDCEAEPPKDESDPRLTRHRPLRLDLTPTGIALAVISLAASVGLVLWRLGGSEWWVAVTLAVAVLITVALWRVASLATERLVWFGIAVFLSVPLFGTLGEIVNNIDHPMVQPMALIRETDGPKESLQGLYVTETSDRLYFANVATEGCGSKVTPHSGRLFWVPKDEVVAMSVGPLQSVQQAGKSALEMSYALTPAIETPGASVALGIDEEQEEKERAKTALHDTRLENSGPAVRPNFGTGLRLEPEATSPGRTVTLRMSRQNKEVEGFGPARAGHNLRIGGEVADIAKEPASGAEDAEFIRVGGGRLVTLSKDGLYVKDTDGNYEKAQGEREGSYAKLEDAAVVRVNGQPVSEGEPTYVKLDGSRVAAKAPTVELAAGRFEGSRQTAETVELAGRPLMRQAWHPEDIRFVVPKDAKSGVVTVECDQLAGAPLLQVTHAPSARIAVRMQQGSGRVTFNSGGSEDEDGKIVSRSWKIGGLRRADRKKISARMPARRGIYSVRLKVTDDEGNVGTAHLRLLRLPTPLFEFDKPRPKLTKLVKEDKTVLREAVEDDPPVAIELDGHADDPGSLLYNLNLSLERDDEVRKDLMPEPAKVSDKTPTLAVEEKAYGERCPIDARSGKRPRNRRVDVFVLDQGVTVKPPDGCHPGRVESSRWHYWPKAAPISR